MGSVAVITDTNSGITLSEAEKAGIFLIPMPFTINGRSYTEGIDLTHEEFYKMLNDNADIHTSQPTAGQIMEVWDKALRVCEEAVYIPMSSGLSGSCQSALVFAENYGGKVQVVDNHRISVTQRSSVYDALSLSEGGMDARSIKNLLEATKSDNSIYIMVDTLKYLQKGGRVTAAAAAFAQILNLKPILSIQGEKLDSFSKCRGTKQAKTIMINAIKNDIEKRFGGSDENRPSVWLSAVHSNDEKSAIEFRDEIEESFPGHSIYIDRLPLSISCHIGPGSLAIACSKILDGGAKPDSSFMNTIVLPTSA